MGGHQETKSGEKQIKMEANATHTPLDGTLELLPICNMDCKMCYVHQTREEMNLQGRMLSCDEWLPIIRSAVDEGLLYLLLTGGEPLLYPEFKRLYTEVLQMGVILSVNTNGTLIDEDWADFFYENGTQRLNITLYGKDDETYERLCGNPKGFTQVMRASDLLRERNVPFRFNCTLTPDNLDQLPELHKISESYGVALSLSAYMMPGLRRGIDSEQQYRLRAEEAAQAEMYEAGFTQTNEQTEKNVKAAREILAKMEHPARLKNRTGFPCHVGHSAFQMNWKGEMQCCGMFAEPKISLLENSFKKCWEYIVDTCEKMPQCQACIDCEMQDICKVCPAACYTETGMSSGRPDYICRMTKYKVSELRKIVENNTKTGEV